MPNKDFTLYFLAKLDASEKAKIASLQEDELHGYIRSSSKHFLELTHNHGTEKEAGPVYKSGNEEGSRGFGHIAYTVPDLDAACQRLQSMGVAFKKLPHEGSMKTIAFALDPDGYWIELLQQS
ncbi:hypothetical protein HDU91_004778 [Kappamyces sp. JEL0680]|nr:hypothetical protein HDU91_004778 [Kappamyces sp. JEL0680]